MYTGPSGGIANDPRRSRQRTAAPEQLILEAAVNSPRALIAEAVNVVIHIAGRGRKRRIESIASRRRLRRRGLPTGGDAMDGISFPSCCRSPTLG